jgi:hypothetical protein
MPRRRSGSRDGNTWELVRAVRSTTWGWNHRNPPGRPW